MVRVSFIARCKGVLFRSIIYFLLCNLLDSHNSVQFILGSKCEWSTKEKCCLRMLVNKGATNCCLWIFRLLWLDASCLLGWQDGLPGWESTVNQVLRGSDEGTKEPKTICTQQRQWQRQQMLLRCCLVLLTAAIWCRWRIQDGEKDEDGDLGWWMSIGLRISMFLFGIPKYSEQIWRRLVMCLQVCEL